MKPKLLFMLALFMGAVTTLLFFQYMNKNSTQTASTNNLIDVVVAKNPIIENQRISVDMLEIVQAPRESIHPNTITDPHKIEGYFTTSNIEVGEIILSHHVKSEKEEETEVSRKIKEGYRAVSIGVNFVQSVSNLIVPEDYVDVVFSEVNETDKTVKTTQLLTKVRVLAVGKNLVEAKEGEEPTVEYTSVTLELTPEDATKVVNASERGSIQFTLHTKIISK